MTNEKISEEKGKKVRRSDPEDLSLTNLEHSSRFFRMMGLIYDPAWDAEEESHDIGKSANENFIRKDSKLSGTIKQK
jgi:hypothetical protein